jgi:hypothetical protein
MDGKLIFLSVKKEMPRLNEQVLCRTKTDKKTTFVYEVGELIETTNGFRWLDVNFQDMLTKPEEWAYLPCAAKNDTILG